MSALGLISFALSSEYRKGQLDEFYYLSKLFNIGWKDFNEMPIFARKYILDKYIEETKKD